MDNPQIAFDYAAWTARYPEFAGVPQATATAYFDEAKLFCRTWRTSVPDCVLPKFLNMITAHIAALNANATLPDGSASPASTLVGRINSAAEGSVNVQSEMNTGPQSGTMAWFLQTKYGAEYWAASGAYRSGRYIPNVTPVVDGIYPFRRAWPR